MLFAKALFFTTRIVRGLSLTKTKAAILSRLIISFLCKFVACFTAQNAPFLRKQDMSAFVTSFQCDNCMA